MHHWQCHKSGRLLLLERDKGLLKKVNGNSRSAIDVAWNKNHQDVIDILRNIAIQFLMSAKIQNAEAVLDETVEETAINLSNQDGSE